jgi:hypothetical protein
MKKHELTDKDYKAMVMWSILNCLGVVFLGKYALHHWTVGIGIALILFLPLYLVLCLVDARI